MGYRDLNTPLAHVGRIFDEKADPVEARIDAVFYEVACEIGLADIDTSIFQDKRDEFMLVYDKFSGHERGGR